MWHSTLGQMAVWKLEISPGSLKVCCGVTLHTRSDGWLFWAGPDRWAVWWANVFTLNHTAVCLELALVGWLYAVLWLHFWSNGCLKVQVGAVSSVVWYGVTVHTQQCDMVWTFTLLGVTSHSAGWYGVTVNTQWRDILWPLTLSGVIWCDH